jgi:2-C-methyl-D-erythritol 4-phosphate cytidylyltransferase
VAKAAYIGGAASAASLIVDTVKRVKDGSIIGTVSRDELVLASTPQIFSVDVYKNAIKDASLASSMTDDNMLVEKTGKEIIAVILENENIKITYPKDLEYAEFILNRREKQCLDSE